MKQEVDGNTNCNCCSRNKTQRFGWAQRSAVEKNSNNNNNNNNMKTCQIVDLAVSADHGGELKENENKDWFLGLTRKLKITMERETDGDTSCNWCTRYGHLNIGTWTGRLGNKRKSEDHPNYRIIKIGRNIEKSPEDFNRLAVTQNLTNNHQLTLVWKLLRV